jgi:hypothetical protein
MFVFSVVDPFVKKGRKKLIFCHFDPFLSFRLKGEILVPSEERDLKDSSHAPSPFSGLRFTGMTREGWE